MKQTMIFLLLILCGTVLAHAETYKWIDNRGVISFTDDPAKIPSRYRDKALKGEYNVNAGSRVKQDPGKLEKKKRLKKLQPSRTVTIPISEQSAREMQQPLKGHLSSDHIEPAPPSMKQPIPMSIGVQPKETPAGMKQPIPMPIGDQPKETPAGMKQPIPIPDQR